MNAHKQSLIVPLQADWGIQTHYHQQHDVILWKYHSEIALILNFCMLFEKVQMNAAAVSVLQRWFPFFFFSEKSLEDICRLFFFFFLCSAVETSPSTKWEKRSELWEIEVIMPHCRTILESAILAAASHVDIISPPGDRVGRLHIIYCWCFQSKSGNPPLHP